MGREEENGAVTGAAGLSGSGETRLERGEDGRGGAS